MRRRSRRSKGGRRRSSVRRGMRRGRSKKKSECGRKLISSVVCKRSNYGEKMLNVRLKSRRLLRRLRRKRFGSVKEKSVRFVKRRFGNVRCKMKRRGKIVRIRVSLFNFCIKIFFRL